MCEENNKALEEYKDLSANLRHFGNMRFAHLTLFFAANAGLLALIFNTKFKVSMKVEFSATIGGIFLTLCFWALEYRAVQYWRHFKDMAKELEKKLNFEQYTKKPPREIISASAATMFIYIISLIFWITLFLNSLCKKV